MSGKLKRNIDELHIQELIDPVDCVYKAYSIFSKEFLVINNTIDLAKIEDPSFVLGRDLKEVAFTEIDDLTKKVAHVVNKALNGMGLMNFGLDFVRKIGTDDFYFFDINTDTLMWAKLVKREEQKFFMSEVLKLSQTLD